MISEFAVFHYETVQVTSVGIVVAASTTVVIMEFAVNAVVANFYW